jgi:hypothetical protein
MTHWKLRAFVSNVWRDEVEEVTPLIQLNTVKKTNNKKWRRSNIKTNEI